MREFGPCHTDDLRNSRRVGYRSGRAPKAALYVAAPGAVVDRWFCSPIPVQILPLFRLPIGKWIYANWSKYRPFSPLVRVRHTMTRVCGGQIGAKKEEEEQGGHGQGPAVGRAANDVGGCLGW